METRIWRPRSIKHGVENIEHNVKKQRKEKYVEERMEMRRKVPVA
jgi:hypothetical protein